MTAPNSEIDENIYLSGALLCEAVFESCNSELLQAYKSSLTIPQNIPDKGKGGGFAQALQAMTKTMMDLQAVKTRRENIYAELKNEILGLIKKGTLMPYGFKEPRNLNDNAIKIPADLFFSGEINWENSELKYRNIEFSGIRLLKDLMPIIDLKPEKQTLPEIKKIGNEKSDKPNKSKSLNYSELPPDRYINEKQASEFLGIAVKTLQGYRVKGGGPEYSKFGAKMVRYKMADLINWAEIRKKKNTSQY
jgi:hypothetical protein